MSSVVPLLKHNPSAQNPEVLEAITVQREPLIASLVDCVLDVDGGPRHQLLVGPRGMGKTHILSLVVSRVKADTRVRQVVIAWLPEDPWPVRTYDKFLAEILAKVADDAGDADLAQEAADLRASDGTRWLEGEEVLRSALGERRLVLLVENLDEVFRRIGEEGQARFRALVEDWRQVLILATSPQLFEGVRDYASPFYGFFAITRLTELSLESALELMKRIADLQGDAELREYLNGEVARRRLAAVEALAGGHPRIWLLLAGCLSVEAIDELVPLFLEALDDLTPYYQDRLRELGEQQQELVVLLSEAGGALSNRALSERSGIAQNQIATTLKHLTERGYVRRAEVPAEFAGGDNRMSFWELREPLMRLCLEVKQARGEPLRMVVEFLRAWYGPKLLDELARIPPEATLANRYASEAFRTLDELLSPEDLFRGSPSEILARAERGLALRPDRFELQMTKAGALMLDGRYEEAIRDLEELLATDDPGLPKSFLAVQLLVARRAVDKVNDVVLDAGLSEILEEAGDNENLIDSVASAYMRFNRHEGALAAFVRAIELRPADQVLWVNRGVALRNLGRYEDALAAFSEAARLDPEEAGTHNRRGAMLSRLGRDSEALEAYGRAAELEPGQALFYSNRGISLRKLNRLEEALAEFVKAAELDPANSVRYSRQASVLEDLGRIEEAANAYGRVLELDPENTVAHNNRGAALVALGRDDEALAAFSRAVELEPERAAFQNNLGAMLAEHGRHDEALAAFEKATELDPSDADVEFNRAMALERLGRYEGSLEAYERALALDPGRGSLHNNRGIVLARLRRYDEAAAAFTRAAELDPTEAVFERNRGSALGSLGSSEQALAAFDRAIDIDSSKADAYAGRGLALRDLGRLDEAVAALGQAIELEPDNPQFHNSHAVMLRELGRAVDAQSEARLAVSLNGETSLFRFTLVEALLSCGDAEEALSSLRAALALWGEEPGNVQPGDADLICRIIWEGFDAGNLRRELIAGIVDAFQDLGVGEELGQGVIASIPLFVGEEVDLARAEAWVDDWGSAPSGVELQIPIAMLKAALSWKRDGDRAHLLSLPPEQREILLRLLSPDPG